MALDFKKEYSLIKKKGYKAAESIMKRRHEKRAGQLYNIAITYGGVLIKMCQYFSARRDIFPDPYITILSPLQDDVPPVPFKNIDEQLRSELGDYTRYFLSIDEQCVSSASLGQVHRAVLFNGETVAIKILKPGIEKIIDLDFSIIYHIFKLMSSLKFFRDMGGDFLRVIEEFITITGDELNFTREAEMAERFRNYFREYEYIKIPRIYFEYSTQKILVMEFIIGDKITDRTSWELRNNDPDIIARRILELYVKQFLSFGTVHYDPHPGNILVLENSSIALLDFGMSGEISDTMINGLKNAVEAILAKNPGRIIESLDKLGFIKKGVNRNILLPVVKFFMDDVIGKAKLGRESFQEIDVSEIKDDIIEIIRSEPFSVPVDWAFIGKTVSTLIGIISSLNPDFPVIETLKPYANEIVQKNLRSTASALLESLKKNISAFYELPVKAGNFIEGIESGKVKIKIDHSRFEEDIYTLKSFFIKLSFFITGVLILTGGYMLHSTGRSEPAFVLFIPGLIFILISLFYRKKSIKEKIKSQF
jgi:predicted unusual protein kinase regulating ubiquinone biosynthesis (AarF/ABC1/UbiB family)